ncbi:hypothetical protein ACH5RR_039749 [Cinchona calisaya]|uniref:Neprosin PEP catalytic domain-containing protein n=1 Tax=Cinchona calisaya TaxID=153742 RepID=A0ABD2Y0V1_9GENT
MEIKWISILILQITLAVIGNGVSSSNRNSSPNFAVKTIHSEDGDVIDCIDIYKQPAFNHPALRDHKIQMTPTFDPTTLTKSEKETSEAPEKGKEDSYITATQIWRKSGSCPEGTVPIRRNSRKSERKAIPVDNFARRKPSVFPHQSKENKNLNLLQPNHSLAVLLTEGYAYYGAKGDIQVWNPPVEWVDEYSSSQVALKSGPHNRYEAVEAGWAVNPGVYGDRLTRVFAYWTLHIICFLRLSGGYAVLRLSDTGFINRIRVVQSGVTKFPDWVNAYSDEYDCYSTFYNWEYMAEPEFHYGGPGRSPRSSTTGSRRYLSDDKMHAAQTYVLMNCPEVDPYVQMFRSSCGARFDKEIDALCIEQFAQWFKQLDPKTNNWWVNYGERINIGYWPGELFSMLRVHAQTVQWGGEVYSSRIGINHPHTKIGMGNGDFSYINDSGSVKRIRIVDNSLVLKYPGYVYPYADEIYCYDCFLFGDVPELEFYFGGPSKNWRCP